MNIFDFLITTAWAVFIITWFVFALQAKKTTNRNFGRRFGIRILIIVVAVFLLRISAVKQFVVAHEITAAYTTNPIFGSIGVLLTLLGIAYAIWARVHLGRNWGMSRSIKEDPELVTSGPYRYIRNPIYTGMILALVGSAFVNGVWWLVIALFAFIYFVYSAKVEENIMLAAFPDTYPAYKKRTKMLIPFLI